MAKPILLYTPIYSETAQIFTEKVLELAKDEAVDIWINGPGGSLSHGWSMIAALHDKDIVNMTVTGDAGSFYFYMLLFANNTTAFDTSSFLVHRAASMWEDMMSEDELKEVESRNKIIRKKLEARIDEDIFEKVTGKTFDDIFDMENRLDIRLNAQQAKKIGLINKVIKLDVKKKEAIEAQYFNDIAALSIPKKEISNNNNNSNNNIMGIFSKDPVLLGAIGESQFVYSKLEVNAKIKALGDGEKEPLTGTFEANDKKVTVVADVITAIEDIDTKQEQINALSSKIIALTALIEEATKKPVEKEVADNSQEQITALTGKVTALTATLEAAKLNVSNPPIPQGEFKEEIAADALTVREELQAMQAKQHEDKRKKREE